MKKIGIIGGIGPESTLDYYRGIIDAFRARGGAIHYPEIVIYSTDINALIEIVESRAFDKLTDWLLERVEALHRAGADFAALASNTPHVVFDELVRRSPLPLLSIVDATCREAETQGVRRAGLLGTKFTMQADFFEKRFRSRGIEIVVPSSEEQLLIHERLFTEIELGIFKEETRQELLQIVKKMIERDRIDSVILGCTELPLILDKPAHGIPFFNTTAIHIESIVRECLKG